MKLITLNIWGGHVRQSLLNFIASRKDIDIFCLQEVYHKAPQKISDDDREVSLNIFSELHALLPEHQAFFSPVVKGIYGIGMFIKKGIEIHDEKSIQIHENPNYIGKGPTHSRNLQYVRCGIDNHALSIVNVHGLWNGKGKKDCPERLAQSKKIRDFVDSLDTPTILCGDFNLRPDTESLKILDKGMKNLIQLHNVQSTRTSLYPKEEKFADYVFTSDEILVNSFQVLEDEVSDHAPLFLDFISEAMHKSNLGRAKAPAQPKSDF